MYFSLFQLSQILDLSKSDKEVIFLVYNNSQDDNQLNIKYILNKTSLFKLGQIKNSYG